MSYEKSIVMVLISTAYAALGDVRSTSEKEFYTNLKNEEALRRETRNVKLLKDLLTPMREESL